ncbi:hypothetical protein ACM55G_14700 [Flavobacterium sp. LB3P122]|uniref:hypothetical protein n=1 Tax=Flavobacterium algoriphilum TaxID=3398738 RepID=UPI003A875ACC
MKRYFEIVNLPIPCSFILNDWTRFDLRTGIPKNSFEVYKKGFPYLGLKPGAEVLFKKETIGSIILLIKGAKRIEDVEILALAKPESEKVQEVAKAKIAEFK